ncbi:hypothetical protein SAMN02983004_00910 [Borreliella japonica]|uniref:Uncharacterized protein n=1 Tax=Borreliella japonica TaxID=34095 RepID=A0A1G4Q383_BORJA|nr:complement regulator-acquiring protein [Borreliella japonica]SCW39036.1 hypothetical protein SAMN02983004_00910 [Borreliella japonica]
MTKPKLNIIKLNKIIKTMLNFINISCDINKIDPTKLKNQINQKENLQNFKNESQDLKNLNQKSNLLIFKLQNRKNSNIKRNSKQYK